MARERTTISAENYESMVRYATNTVNKTQSDINRLHATLRNHGPEAAVFDAISYLNTRDDAAGNINAIIQDLEEMLPEEEMDDNYIQLNQYGLEALARQARHEQHLVVDALNILKYVLDLLEMSTTQDNPLLPVFMYAEERNADRQEVSDGGTTNSTDPELDAINEGILEMEMEMGPTEVRGAECNYTEYPYTDPYM